MEYKVGDMLTFGDSIFIISSIEGTGRNKKYFFHLDDAYSYMYRSELVELCKKITGKLGRLLYAE